MFAYESHCVVVESSFSFGTIPSPAQHRCRHCVSISTNSACLPSRPTTCRYLLCAGRESGKGRDCNMKTTEPRNRVVIGPFSRLPDFEIEMYLFDVL